MAGDRATGKAMSDVVQGTMQARKVVIADRLNRVNQLVHAEEVTFVEAGDTTYTGTVKLPPGAYIIDIILHCIGGWDDGTSATMILGESTDDNGFFDAVNLKATDLVATESISFGFSGGKEGADVDGGESAGDHLRRRFLAGARDIIGVITTGGQDGSAGRTRMTVIWVLPVAGATPVAVA